MTGKYKEQWINYFEGGIEMWSYFGYKYHSYIIVKNILPELNVPKKGKLIQMGTGLGVTVELLCHMYGEDRVVGYDLFNPLGHSNIKFLDTTKTIPSDKDIAFLEIDICSMSDAREHRKNLLTWAMTNVKTNGYILTNKSLAHELKSQWNFDIINLNEFDIPDIWNNPHENRINTKVILQMKAR
tara:strand:- start:245 stop:796 length:552 start_codon:yes stop_codon:yes gene_type:complete